MFIYTPHYIWGIYTPYYIYIYPINKKYFHCSQKMHKVMLNDVMLAITSILNSLSLHWFLYMETFSSNSSLMYPKAVVELNLQEFENLPYFERCTVCTKVRKIHLQTNHNYRGDFFYIKKAGIIIQQKERQNYEINTLPCKSHGGISWGY